MIKILCIETSEKQCSVALSIDGECVDYTCETSENSHARLLTILISQLLEKNNTSFEQLSAICVSSGPGSYTGLRIGVSTAKGICWAQNLNLISLTSTEILAEQGIKTNNSFDIYVTALDARRNEVFMAIYDKNSKIIQDVTPTILDESPLSKHNKSKKIIIGSGAHKFNDFVSDNDVIVREVSATAEAMCNKAFLKYNNKEFEDVAYFEPTYFKAVHTTVSKKKLF